MYFLFMNESKEAEPVYSDLKIPEPESPEKIVEELVSDTFPQTGAARYISKAK